jgi:hypothetical protein
LEEIVSTNIPNAVEACQFVGDNYFQCAHFVGLGDLTHVTDLQETDTPVVSTGDGLEVVKAGNWIVKDGDGNCRVFTHEKFVGQFAPAADVGGPFYRELLRS